MNKKPNNPAPSYKQRARLLKIIGIIILSLGIAGAGIVYWLGTRSPDSSDDLSMVGFNRAETRQLGYLYGKQGRLIEDLTDDLKQPGTQAIIIVVTAALVAGGCFYFARLLDLDDKSG